MYINISTELSYKTFSCLWYQSVLCNIPTQFYFYYIYITLYCAFIFLEFPGCSRTVIYKDFFKAFFSFLFIFFFFFICS